MENNGLISNRSVALILSSILATTVLIGTTQAVAADDLHLPAQFSGLLNDYTPPAPTVSNGPYEMHGVWSLLLRAKAAATFTAEMSMETADFANTDPNKLPGALGPHTHHISVTDGVVHSDPTDPINLATSCPTFKPAVSEGFIVTGTAFVTGNGTNPPFGNPSTVTICILGNLQNPTISGPQAFVEFSNFTLAFGPTSVAATHFGTQAINGVVVSCSSRGGTGQCKVQTAD
jgi:hypothetical protein